MLLRQITDPLLAQYAYLIGCQRTKEALVIDPERDIDRYLAAAEAEGLIIRHVAETHIHADYLTGARQFAEEHDVTLYLSDEGAPDWTYEWARGRSDVRLLRDGDGFRVGKIEVRAVHTPGHTPEHLTFVITDHGGGADEPIGIATGDFVFVGDLGRPDLLETAAGQASSAEPSARQLFRSVTWLEELPDYLQVWPGHGAGSACGKALGAVPQTTLGYEKRFNRALQAARDGEGAFMAHILEGQTEPPLYFKRMKELNRNAPPLLDRLPRPGQLRAAELDGLLARDEVTVIDTRHQHSYGRGHLPGAILAPLDRTFPTVAGSYVFPEEPICLVIGEDDLEQAVRSLVRIGLDDVRGYITPETLQMWGDGTDRLRMLKDIDFDELDGRRHYTNVQVLDVRSRSEWEQKHIPDAVNVPYVRLREHLDELPRDKTLLVHCAAGARSAVAAAFLHSHGFCVAHVDDHFENWKERHLGPGVEAGAH